MNPNEPSTTTLETILVGIPIVLISTFVPYGCFIMWRGRTKNSRWWTSGDVESPDSAVTGRYFALAFLPGGGLLFFGVGLFLIGLNYLPVLGILGGVGFIIIVWGSLIAVVSRFYWPARKLWGPRWFTHMPRELYLKAKNKEDDALTVGLGRRPHYFGEPLDVFFAWQLNAPGTTDLSSPRDADEGYLVVSEAGLWMDAFSTHPFNAPVRVRWEDVRTVSRVPVYRRCLTGRLAALPLLEIDSDRGKAYFRIGWLDSFSARRKLSSMHNAIQDPAHRAQFITDPIQDHKETAQQLETAVRDHYTF